MAGFNLDFNDVFEGGKIDDGYYEVVVNRCNEDATPGGAEYTEFDLIIRNDIDQPNQNKHIFHKVWKSKADQKYNMKQFNTIGKACQLQNGKSYSSFNDLLNDFEGKTALVFVKNETSEYNGKTYENLNVKMWQETKYPQLQHQFKQKEGGSTASAQQDFNGPVNVQDDDLPF